MLWHLLYGGGFILICIFIVKGKNEPPYPGGGRDESPFPPCSQLGRLSGKCAGAGRLGPVVFLKECCNGCSSRAGSRR